MSRQYRVALYARVSTSNGHQDPEMQLRELREFIDRRGWQITGEYVDKGISGSKDSRPALDRLMADASAGSSMRCSFGSSTGSADRSATSSTLWRSWRPSG